MLRVCMFGVCGLGLDPKFRVSLAAEKNLYLRLRMFAVFIKKFYCCGYTFKSSVRKQLLEKNVRSVRKYIFQYFSL